MYNFPEGHISGYVIRDSMSMCAYDCSMDKSRPFRESLEGDIKAFGTKKRGAPSWNEHLNMELSTNINLCTTLPDNSLLILNHGIVSNYKLVRNNVIIPTLDTSSFRSRRNKFYAKIVCG